MPDGILDVLSAVAPSVFEIIKDLKQRPKRAEEWQTILTAIQVEETHRLRADIGKLRRDEAVEMEIMEKMVKLLTQNQAIVKRIERDGRRP